ncbi:MAG: GNAT family N-acetyltransferase [Anaerolineales bacterium]|jgi:RimJ/RimL family protein N-acetyltransferase
MAEIEPRAWPIKTGDKIIVRCARSSDADKILGIWRYVVSEGAYTLREPDEFKRTESDVIHQIEGHQKGGGSLYLVAEIEGKIVGLLEFSNGQLRRTAHSGMLTMLVDAEWRDVGVGTALLESLLSWARESPIIEKVTLATFSTNKRAFNLYKKMGFRQEGYCPRDMKVAEGQYIDSILMYQFV